MDHSCSPPAGGETDPGMNSTSFPPHNAQPSLTTSTSSPSAITRPLGFSRRIMSAIKNAEPRSEGGVEIVLHTNIVSGKELKRALDPMFSGPQEYSVQLRRDRYRVSLPNHNKADIERYISKR